MQLLLHPFEGSQLVFKHLLLLLEEVLKRIIRSYLENFLPVHTEVCEPVTAQ